MVERAEMWRCRVGLLGILVGSLGAAAAWAEPAVGWVDNARIYPGAISTHARMDSGARISSLRFETQRVYRKDGKRWVVFTVKDRKERLHRLRRPLARMIRVKKHGGGFDRRAVVRLGLCVGNQYKEVEVSLARRTDFNYPLLIGRNYLSGTYLVDPGTTFTSRPNCPTAPLH
jgi:hypothetical protein